MGNQSKDTIRIGTRGSKLALIQANMVKQAIERVAPQIQCELLVMQTQGDRILDKPLLAFGGKGVFVEEFEEKIISGELDIAVHSAKDMPMFKEDTDFQLPSGLRIISVLKREDPRDVLITKNYNHFCQNEGCVVGTSSLRRQVQMKDLYSNIQTKSLRGNVPTRLQKLEDGLYDGIILAAAGIKRLNLDQEEKFQYHYFDIEQMIPASGQGIIAIEGRADHPWKTLFDQICDKEAWYQLEMERYALSRMNAGCHDPIGIYTEIHDDEVDVWMMREENGRIIKKRSKGYLEDRFHLIDHMVLDIMGGS